MAKGDDKKRAETDLSQQNSLNQQNLADTRQRQQNMYNLMTPYYQQGAQKGLQSYDDIMNNLKTWMGTTTGASNPMPSSTGSTGMPERPQDLRQALETANQTAYGGKKPVQDSDVAYWSKMWGEDPEYTFKRMLGWQAGGNDVASSGPYAGANSGAMSNNPFYNGMTSALSGYQNFANTGGFSPQDIQNIRARGIAPIRSVYANANRDVDTQRRIQNGFSPNYTAAKAKMAREQAYSTSDAATNVEASIAQLLQQGKLAGLGGLSSTGSTGRGLDLTERGQNLSGMNAMTSLFGTNPGLAQTFGNQVLTSQGQDLQGQALSQQLMEAILKGDVDISKIPGAWQKILGNIAQIADIAGTGASALSGIKSL